MRRPALPIRLLSCATVALLLSAAGASSAEAQIWKKVKAKAEQRIDNRVDNAIDRSLDAVECVITDPECIESAKAEGRNVVVVDEEGNPVSPSNGKPGEGAWANYDFTPGDRVLFFDDFSGDQVGDFPRRFEFRSGNMQIVEWQGRRWLNAEDGEVLINLPEVLPERFTIEFDLAGDGNRMQINFQGDQRNAAPLIELSKASARLESGQIEADGDFNANTGEQPVSIRIAVDGKHVKLYANERRALNVPNADLGRSDRIYLWLQGMSSLNPWLISNLRIAAGGKDLYDALAADGRVATQGIFFDTGSDTLRPESTPTLKAIAQMIEEHEDLNLTIEGHTDNAGDEAANQNLSERRAASVRAYLVEQHGIDPERLVAEGMGESSPAASNDTPEGRQQNRRVELVKR